MSMALMSWNNTDGVTLGTTLRRSNASEEEVMVKKVKAKKKKVSALGKIKKELEKLEKLHDKENDVVEKINDIIDEDEDDGSGWHGLSRNA